MSIKASVHSHAAERLKQRFDLDESFLQRELESGKFVWLTGLGRDRNEDKVRYGHLMYIPHKDEYCVVVMDSRSWLAITILTEEMALKSPWGQGLSKTAKFKAKQIALGKEQVDDSSLLLLRAEEKGDLSVNLSAKTYSFDWKSVVVSLCKIRVKAAQIDPNNRVCILTGDQEIEATKAIGERVANNKMQPYCDLFISDNRGRKAMVCNKIHGVSELVAAEMARRWTP